jgi:hypothetical protein
MGDGSPPQVVGQIIFYKSPAKSAGLFCVRKEILKGQAKDI